MAKVTPTANPIPSQSPTDLRYNSQTLDEIVNSSGLVLDRFGNQIPTLDEFYSNLGYILIQDFDTGATITKPNEALLWDTADGGDGEYYRWDGTLPKTVPAASTPASTGGVGAGAWLGVGEAALRSELAETDSQVSIAGETAERVSKPRIFYLTEAEVATVDWLEIGDIVIITDRANSFWDVIAATTNNGRNIIDGTSSGVSLTLKIKNKTVQAEAVGITTALADCKTATEAVLALSEINRIEFGYGTYAFSSLQLVDSQEIAGRGREHTKFTFSGTLTQDGVTYSFGCNGGSSPALTDLNQAYGIEMDFTGATGGIGWYISKKVLARDVYVHDADSHGIYWRSVNSGTEAPYFSQLDSCWSKSNGGSGMKVTENCNQNTFINCLFDSNTEHGVHHQLVSNGQPTALYGNTYISGQASYNELHGFYLQDGSEYSMYNVYNEFNSQTDGGNPKTGAYKNVQLGTNVARCTILLGSQGTSSDIFDAIGLNTNTSNKVHIGNLDGGAYDQLTIGYENVGSGRDITLNGAGGAEHNIYFREGTADVFRIQYNGTPANPANELLIQSYDSGAWTTVVKLTNNGRISFFDAATQQRQTVTGSTGGNAALQNLLTALDNIGLITDSTT